MLSVYCLDFGLGKRFMLHRLRDRWGGGILRERLKKNRRPRSDFLLEGPTIQSRDQGGGISPDLIKTAEYEQHRFRLPITRLAGAAQGTQSPLISGCDKDYDHSLQFQRKQVAPTT